MVVSTIGVVGSGQMGRGIAQVAAFYGFEVLFYDISEECLENALLFISKQLSRGIEKGKWSQQLADETFGRIKTINSLELLNNCDLAIEAATENKSIKLNIFQSLSNITRESCVLATNTSSISITEIAAVTNKPEMVVGMHFMNPVPVMKLVEGIRGLETSDKTFNAIRLTAEKMGKVFIEARDMPGFAVNRILMPMINEAIFALHEGVASVEDIDLAMKLGTNWPMGPLKLADFIGLDTCLAIMDVLHTGMGDPKYRPCLLLKQYVQAGRLGKKSKRGFYEY